MSKRRNKGGNKPNLPQATLDRARRQAGLEAEEANEEVDVTSSSDDSDDVVASTPKQSTVERAARRRKLSPVQLERSRKRGELTNEMVSELLHNPTEYVSEEELAQEYSHVLKDLRNMGVLAAVLMVVLVGLAQFI